MTHWAFVTAAYVLTALVTGGVSLASWRAMRLAEDTPASKPAKR